MPVYSYACKSCGHKFDVHQDFSDDSLTICPECQGQLKKVFGTVGISFKLGLLCHRLPQEHLELGRPGKLLVEGLELHLLRLCVEVRVVGSPGEGGRFSDELSRSAPLRLMCARLGTARPLMLRSPVDDR